MPGSKRLSLRQQHKIQKKKSEYHKQQRKEARQNPHKRPKLKKDPGIPNLWPLKEQMLDQAAQEKSRNQDAARLAKMERREQLEELRRKAEEAEGDFEDRVHKVNDEARYFDSSRKAFFKEFKKVIKASDVILEVIDARDPIGTRCIDIERQILAADPTKKIVLILNKIDLISKENLAQWLKLLRNELPTVAFKSSIQQQRSNVSQSRQDSLNATSTGGSECLGAKTLLSLLKNYARSKKMKVSITVGIIGIPNVGKSSLINSLKRARAVGVGATPGFTRSMQEVVLDENIKLLDCPGIIFASSATEAEAVLRNAVKLDQVRDIFAPVELIISKCSHEQLMVLYSISRFVNAVDFLTLIAKKRGKIKPGGIVDVDAAARLILQDWNSGKIPYMSIPPKDISQIDAVIVPSWSEEFNIAAIEALESEHIFQQLPEPSQQFVTIEAGKSMKADAMFAKMYDDDNDELHYDDMEADDESEEEQGMDDGEAEKPSKPTTTIKKKKFVDEDDAINPKEDRAAKLAARRRAKAERKSRRAEEEDHPLEPIAESESSESEQDYDFGADFWTSKPSSEIITDSRTSTAPSGFNEFDM